ncbi:27690_t:CDS:2, partial [Gigaspora margarita]
TPYMGKFQDFYPSIIEPDEFEEVINFNENESSDEDSDNDNVLLLSEDTISKL